MSGSNEPVTTGNRMVTSNVRQLSDGNGETGGPGTALGFHGREGRDHGENGGGLTFQPARVGDDGLGAGLQFPRLIEHANGLLAPLCAVQP